MHWGGRRRRVIERQRKCLACGQAPAWLPVEYSRPRGASTEQPSAWNVRPPPPAFQAVCRLRNQRRRPGLRRVEAAGPFSEPMHRGLLTNAPAGAPAPRRRNQRRGAFLFRLRSEGHHAERHWLSVVRLQAQFDNERLSRSYVGRRPEAAQAPQTTRMPELRKIVLHDGRSRSGLRDDAGARSAAWAGSGDNAPWPWASCSATSPAAGSADDHGPAGQRHGRTTARSAAGRTAAGHHRQSVLLTGAGRPGGRCET